MSTQEQHPIEYLFNEQKKLPYHRWYGVEPVKEMIARNAFFPGGSGLWSTPTDKEWQVLSRLQICRSFFDNLDRLSIMPIGKVMVLGQDFGPKCWHEKYLREEAYDLDCPTWRNLLQLLQEADIQPKDCFFTNAYMGLMEGEDNTGKFSGADNPEFVGRCESFFLDKQIRIQKPSLIIVLGADARRFIVPLSCDLIKWKKCKTFPQLDASDSGPLLNCVRFNGSKPATVVALLHPSERYRNAHLRSYQGKSGTDAELAMLKDAWEQSGISDCS